MCRREFPLHELHQHNQPRLLRMLAADWMGSEGAGKARHVAVDITRLAVVVVVVVDISRSAVAALQCFDNSTDWYGKLGG